MALLSCPECGGRVSDQADVCPHCGLPLVKVEYEFVDVWFNISWIQGERRLNELVRNGWQIVGQQEVVEWEDGTSIDITKYKLQKRCAVLVLERRRRTMLSFTRQSWARSPNLALQAAPKARRA